jgi:hypothetical protein
LLVGLEGVVKLDSIVKPFATVVIASADQALEVLNCLSFGLELPCVEDLSCLAFVGLELPCVEDLSCLAFVGLELPCTEDLSCLQPCSGFWRS